MGQATRTTADAILKEDYLGPLRSQINSTTPSLDRLEKNKRDIVGREAWIPTEMALSQAAGARGEDAVLPAAGSSTFKELKVPLKYYYGVLGVTGPVMRATEKGDRGSFGRIVDHEVRGMKRTLGLTVAHDIYLGPTLADCGTTSGSTTVQLNTTTSNMLYFEIGMVVDIIVKSTGAESTGKIGTAISAIDTSNFTITVADSVTTDSTFHVARTLTQVLTSKKTMTPLVDIVDSSTDIYSVTTSSYDRWKSQEDSSTTTLGLSELADMTRNIHVDSGKMPTVIYSNPLLQQKYWELLTLNPRYTPTSPPKTIGGGFRSLEFTGGGAAIPWIADRLCPNKHIFFLHEPDLQFYTPADWQFIEISGSVWLPDIFGASGKDNWKAVLYRDIELGAYARNSHGKMTAITG